MKFENTRIMGFEGAIRGMRNPKNSWSKSDSYFDIITTDWVCGNEPLDVLIESWIPIKFPDVNVETMSYNEFCDKDDEVWQWLDHNMHLDYSANGDYTTIAAIGPNDMKLMQQLIKSGSEHRKFMRQIFVSVDITAPLYWWKEMDQYKVGTVTNSTSTMHKLASTPITLDCFEKDNVVLYAQNPTNADSLLSATTAFIYYITYLENLRQEYNKTKDKNYWRTLIQMLPENWLQKRTWTCNYETLLGICSKGQRRNHKLTEWGEDFISWARSLPYSQELLFFDELNENA